MGIAASLLPQILAFGEDYRKKRAGEDDREGVLISRFRYLPLLAWRESRTARRRLLLYMSSISFGVAALVAIDSFSDNVTTSVHDQSRALMGGDLAATSREKFPKAIDSVLDVATKRDRIIVARSTNFPSMVVYSPFLSTRLVEVRAITPGYPLYGEITSAPAEAWAQLHGGRNVVVDRGLLATLQASVGDSLSLGSAG